MFLKQIIMRRVVYSLVPIILFSIYLYGPFVLAIMATSYALGIATEYLMERNRGKTVSEAVLVTCGLFALSLPPRTPLWIVAVGIVFAVALGKEVYGGFGRNIFNPAITGRLFVYIAFPAVLATSWAAPTGWLGSAADALSGPTPLDVLRSGGGTDLLNLFLGLRSGSIGESSIVLILLAGIYLVATKTANWRLIVATIGGAGLTLLGFDLAGVPGSIPTLPALLSGSILFVAVFMVTDPVSAPKKPLSQFIYGGIVGITAMLIRLFSAFPEGTSFGLLIGNTFASLIDQWVGPKPAAKPKEVAK